MNFLDGPLEGSEEQVGMDQWLHSLQVHNYSGFPVPPKQLPLVQQI
jgi:hypothetical protein